MGEELHVVLSYARSKHPGSRPRATRSPYKYVALSLWFGPCTERVPQLSAQPASIDDLPLEVPPPRPCVRANHVAKWRYSRCAKWLSAPGSAVCYDNGVASAPVMKQ